MPRIARRKDNELMLYDEKRSLHYYRVSIEVISRMEKDIWATSREDALAQGNLEAKRGFQGWHMKQIIKRAKVSWFPRFWMDAPF